MPAHRQAGTTNPKDFPHKLDELTLSRPANTSAHLGPRLDFPCQVLGSSPLLQVIRGCWKGEAPTSLVLLLLTWALEGESASPGPARASLASARVGFSRSAPGRGGGAGGGGRGAAEEGVPWEPPALSFAPLPESRVPRGSGEQRSAMGRDLMLEGRDKSKTRPRPPRCAPKTLEHPLRRLRPSRGALPGSPARILPLPRVAPRGWALTSPGKEREAPRMLRGVLGGSGAAAGRKKSPVSAGNEQERGKREG